MPEEAAVRKENHALRSITAVMMLFIAIVHYDSCMEIFGNSVHLIVKNIGRFVIPVFFLISGYFCYSKDGHAEAGLKRKMMHILFLILIYKVAYFLFSTILCIAGKVGFDYVITEFLTVSPPFTFDCYGGTVSIMTTQPIWFIYSLFLIYGLFFILYAKNVDFKWSWLIAIPILVIMLMVDILPMIGVTDIGGVAVDSTIGGTLYPFITLPFFVIGYYLHKHKEQIDTRLTNGMIWTLIFGGFFLMVIEAYFRPDHYNSMLYIGSFIFSISVFLGTFRVPEDRGRCHILEYIGKYLTMWMYVFFGIANFIVRYAVQSFSDSEIITEVLGPFIALILDIIMAIAFDQFLKYLGRRKSAEKKAVEEPVVG